MFDARQPVADPSLRVCGCGCAKATQPGSDKDAEKGKVGFEEGAKGARWLRFLFWMPLPRREKENRLGPCAAQD